MLRDVFGDESGPGDRAGGIRSGSGVFATTHWSAILAAQGDAAASQVWLEELCRNYWFPVYALVRHSGLDAETSRDFTQEFFARLVRRGGLANARRERGRFRSYLSQAVRNFLRDEWDRARAEKRGGGVRLLSLEDEADSVAEIRYQQVIPHGAAPDVEFDRRWAQELLARSRERLRAEYAAQGREEWIEILDRLGDPEAAPLATHAERLGLPMNTLKSHLHRARQRHGAILRELVAETVSTPAEVDEELRHLLAALSSA